MSNLKTISSAFSRGLRPIEKITVSEWANKYRFLTSVSSAEPGRYRIDRTPYLREIQDHLGKTSDAQEIIFCKGSQIGATETMNNFIGYSIHIDPTIILLVMPTDEAIKKNSKTRIKPMIDATPVLKERIKPVGGRDSENTVNAKSFDGGALLMIGANSPVGLSSTPAAKLMLDEVDRYPLSAGNEGSPIDLARARTRTFANKKMYIASTPTVEGNSVVWEEFEKGDCRYYNVPCIHCKELFIITFDCLTWESGKPETTRCACPKCGGLHEERHKTFMLAEKGYGGFAEWIPTKKPSSPRKFSYHLAALYSPAGFYSWEEVVRDYEDIQGNSNKEQVFVNTVLGETYKIKGEVPEFENIYNRRELYPIGIVPEPVYFLTIGADVQPDRIECEVVGWCKGLESYSIRYDVFSGDTAKDEVWQQLKDLINTQFVTSDGFVMPVRFSCVDSGYNTKKVYDFCASMGTNRVVPVKGMPPSFNVLVSSPKVLNVSKAGKKIGSSKVWGVGVSMLKSELYGFLKLNPIRVEGESEIYPAGYCHFPEYDINYFKMLTAEQLQMIKNKKTKKVSYEWVKIRDRNEALDVRNYARAAAYILGADRFKDEHWLKIKNQKMPVDAIEKQASAKTPIKKKSDFWKR